MSQAYCCERCEVLAKESCGKVEVSALKGSRLFVKIGDNDSFTTDLCPDCAIAYLEEAIKMLSDRQGDR